MRKAVLFFVFIVCVLSLSLINVQPAQVFKNASVKSYFLEEPSCDYIKAYPFYIAEGNYSGAAAQSFKFEYSSLNLKKLLSSLNARLVRTEYVDEIKVSCYYSSLLPQDKKIEIDGEISNLQVAVSGGFVTVGFPIILGSF